MCGLYKKKKSYEVKISYGRNAAKITPQKELSEIDSTFRKIFIANRWNKQIKVF